MKNYQLSRMKYHIELGNYQAVDSPDPSETGSFVADTELWCGMYNTTADQKIQMQTGGTQTKEIKMIVIRHRSINGYEMARFQGNLFKIQSFETDDSLNGFDIIELTRWTEDET